MESSSLDLSSSQQQSHMTVWLLDHMINWKCYISDTTIPKATNFWGMMM